MSRYVVSGAAGAASSTAATAGLAKIDNPASATMAAARITEWAVGPGAAAEDSNYTVQIKRQTTAGTWTNAVTAAPKDPKAGASVTLAARVQTAQGTPGTAMGAFGFNQRGGIRYVCTPGGEWYNTLTFSYGIVLEYLFVQGTAVNYPYIEFEE